MNMKCSAELITIYYGKKVLNKKIIISNEYELYAEGVNSRNQAPLKPSKLLYVIYSFIKQRCGNINPDSLVKIPFLQSLEKSFQIITQNILF